MRWVVHIIVTYISVVDSTAAETGGTFNCINGNGKEVGLGRNTFNIQFNLSKNIVINLSDLDCDQNVFEKKVCFSAKAKSPKKKDQPQNDLVDFKQNM